ncbi:hypothetical protein C815_00546 [Firmicutes bacterium M10-2]|nr:hypothetical protein C815_00546 [Firmicutes bacterium M10-2]
MNRYKYLFKNIGLLTLSNFTTKFLSFFLVPLYTNLLTTTQYGTYDLFNTTIGVLLPILTLNIQEGVMRFALDKNFNRKAIVTVSVKYLLIANLLIILGLFLNSFFNISPVINEYGIFLFLMFFVQSLSGVLTCYIRGIDRIADLSVSSIFSSLITIILNILFLLAFRWGLYGYFLANIIGPLVQCFYLVIRADIIQNIKFRDNYEEENDKMLRYSKPLIANSIAWWVNNASDRYVVIFFCGLAQNGIYSVASKIPSILNIFQSIFNQAWTLSAVQDFDREDKNGFFTNSYNIYNFGMVMIASGLIFIDKILAKFLYAKEFYIAWEYVPFLLISIVFGALSGYIGGIFSAVRNSKIFAVSTIIGAAINIAMNIALVPFIGAMGAAIATAVSYFVVWAVRMKHVKKYIRLRIKLKRDILSYFILVIQAIVLLFILDSFILYSSQMILIILLILLYKKELKYWINKVWKIKKVRLQ